MENGYIISGTINLMSGKKSPSNFYAGYRKNRSKKRQATSPLNDHVASSVTKGENLNNNREQKKVRSKKSRQECTNTKNSDTHPNEIGTTSGFVFTNMSFQTQQTQQPGSGFNVLSQPSYIPNSSPTQYSAPAFGYQPPLQPQPQPPPPPPPWASELLEEIKQIKTKLQTMDEIKKTVNSINVKVCDLEGKMKTLETRVTETEKSSNFIEKEYETNKKELKTAKSDIQTLKKSCDSFEKTSKSLSVKNDELSKKLIDLEARSMRENLMFYGIPEEGEKENCEAKVKQVMTNILHMESVEEIIFDRAHRVGQRSASTRPIVVKFHNYTQREKVRQTAFGVAEELKAAKLGVGAQIPKDIRDARKPLYPAMKKAKDEGKSVKFMGKKLYIDGNEYKTDTKAGTGEKMEH